MNRATLNRLRRLEAGAGVDGGMVHLVPAISDADFQIRKARMIASGAGKRSDWFVYAQVPASEDEREPLPLGVTVSDLLTDIAARGWKVHESPRA